MADEVGEFLPYAAMGVAVLLGAPMWVAAGVGIATGYAVSQMSKPKLPTVKDISPDGHLVNLRDNQAPVPIVYGEMRVGGNIVYASTSGDKNKFLHLVITLSEGEIDSLVELYIDGKPYTDYGSLITYEFYTGSSTQNYSTALNSVDSNWIDPLRHTAYVYVKLEYSADKFQTVPEITALIRGRKLYDVKTGMTTYSNNPANVIYDFLTNTRYGLGIPSSWIDIASFQSAYDWYATNGFTFNGIINQRQKGIDNLSNILASCRSTIIYSQGKFKLLPLDYDPSVLHIPEEAIVEGSIRRSIPTLQDLPNQIRVKFINPNNNWLIDDVVIYDAQAIANDGDVIEKEVMTVGITDHDLARRIGIYHLNRLRWNETVSFRARLDAIELDAGDIFTLTYSDFNYNAKRFRVQSLKYVDEGIVEIEGIAEDASIYDDTISTVTHGSYTVHLPDPSDPNNLPPPYVNKTDLTFAFTQLPEGYNLIINSDFDNGLQNWVKWSGGDIQVVNLSASEAPVGRRAAQNVSTTGDCWWTSEMYIPVQKYRTYIVEGFFKTVSGTSGTCYLAVQLLDENLNNITGDGTWWYYPAGSFRPPTSWTLYKGAFGYGTSKPFPSNAAYMRVGFILNYGTGANSIFQVTGLRIREMIESAFIVNGAIQTAHIQDLAVTSAKIANASITNAKIQDLAVSTLKIQHRAVTLPVWAYNPNSLSVPENTWQTIITSPSFNNQGQPIHIVTSFYSNAGATGVTYMRILRNGVDITGRIRIAYQGNGDDAGVRAFTILDTPPAGTYQYSVQVYHETAYFIGVSVSHRSIVCSTFLR